MSVAVVHNHRPSGTAEEAIPGYQDFLKSLKEKGMRPVKAGAIRMSIADVESHDVIVITGKGEVLNEAQQHYIQDELIPQMLDEDSYIMHYGLDNPKSFIDQYNLLKGNVSILYIIDPNTEQPRLALLQDDEDNNLNELINLVFKTEEIYLSDEDMMERYGETVTTGEVLMLIEEVGSSLE